MKCTHALLHIARCKQNTCFAKAKALRRASARLATTAAPRSVTLHLCAGEKNRADPSKDNDEMSRVV